MRLNRFFIHLWTGIMAGVFFLVYSCKPNEDVVLKVKVFKMDSGTAYLLSEDLKSLEMVVDTINFKNGAFEVKKKHSDALIYKLLFKGGISVKDFFLSPGETFIDYKDSLLENCEIKGQKAQQDYEAYSTQVIGLLKKYDSISQSLQNNMQDYSEAKMKAFEAEIQKYSAERAHIDSVFIHTHLASEIVPYILLLNLSGSQITPDAALELLKKLDKSVQKTIYAQRIITVTDRTPILGKEVKDFSQNDPDGKPIKLSDFRGKVVLIDFWASWCKPCRNYNPTLVKIYEKYHPLGLEILGVSLDSDKQDWLEAIVKDGLKWHHMSDLKHWENSVAQAFGVKSIPSSFLVDKEGKFVLLEPSEEELVKKLDELLGSK